MSIDKEAASDQTAKEVTQRRPSRIANPAPAYVLLIVFSLLQSPADTTPFTNYLPLAVYSPSQPPRS